MTTLRRTFQHPMGQLLVTVNLETREVIAATRVEGWDAWSRPLPELSQDDDTEAGRRRHPQGMLVVPLSVPIAGRLGDDPAPAEEPDVGP